MVFGKRYLITLLIVLILLWIIIFSWFIYEENKYKDDVVDKSSFARSYYEIENNGKKLKKYYANAFTDSIYFISTMFGTFGYGDIYPKTNSAKGLITCMHFIVIIFIMGLYENIFVSNKTIKDLSLNIMKLSSELPINNSIIKSRNYRTISDPSFSNVNIT
jgi:hypothetical protein